MADEEEITFVDTICENHVNALGETVEGCNARPVTFCPNCKRFYVKLDNGAFEEIAIHHSEEDFTYEDD